MSAIPPGMSEAEIRYLHGLYVDHPSGFWLEWTVEAVAELDRKKAVRLSGYDQLNALRYYQAYANQGLANYYQCPSDSGWLSQMLGLK